MSNTQNTQSHSKAAPLLIEIGCEELPPKDLKALSESFADSIASALDAGGFEPKGQKNFASPRRLAVLFEQVLPTQPDQTSLKRGPSIKSAYDKDGNPSRAAQGFAKSVGVEVDALQTIDTDKGPCLGYEVFTAGQALADVIAEMTTQALKRLPISKRMRWGKGEHEFVRPVHWIVALHGDVVLPIEIYSIQSSNTTRGHRIHHPDPITLRDPLAYEKQLKSAYVIADYSTRKASIREQVQSLCNTYNAEAKYADALLNEVTGLVEWPVALSGEFDERFLNIPSEVLTISMEEHQRYFSLRDKQSGRYLNRFITIANLESQQPEQVVKGNERVIEPRFADAEFFWDKDKKTPLENQLPLLADVIFHKQIGSQGERVARMIEMSGYIAEQISADVSVAKRIATLSKCDLLTDMVQEFPELQGSMGKYYALEQGESLTVAEGIEQHYLPRFAGDTLPVTAEAQAVAIAEKLDTIMSLFSIEQYPTGSKDPYALRRAALGIIRIMTESELSVDLQPLVKIAAKGFKSTLKGDVTMNSLSAKVVAFILERFKHKSQSEASAEQVAAVLSKVESASDSENIELSNSARPVNLYQLSLKINALVAFNNPDALQSIANAAKRSTNLLSEATQYSDQNPDQKSNVIHDMDDLVDQLASDAEIELAKELPILEITLAKYREQRAYSDVLSSLAEIATKIDRFFENTLIMTDDESLRSARLSLVSYLRSITLADYNLSVLSK